MVGALDGLYWSMALGLPVYHGLPHDCHESSGDSSGDLCLRGLFFLRECDDQRHQRAESIHAAWS